MTTKAMMVLVCDRRVDGPVKVNAGTVQQETRLYQEDKCYCVLLTTYTPGSEIHNRAMAAFTAAFPDHHPDDLRNVREWTLESDVQVPA